MNKEWVNDYFQLKELVAGRPDVEITVSTISIPDDIRPEFFRLFNQIRTSYIKGTFPGMLNEAGELGNRYAEARDRAVDLLKLKNVELDPQLEVFLKDACGGLIGKLYNPLFDVLKGKSDLVVFEDTSARIVKDSFKSLLYYGYEYWAALSLISRIAPETPQAESVYSVPMPDQFSDALLHSDEARLISDKLDDDVRDIIPAKIISFDINKINALMVPKVILRSDRLGAYAAVGVDMRNVFRYVKNIDKVSKTMEWLNIESIRANYGALNLWPSMCIYVSDKPRELRLEADFIYVARPDVVVEIMESADWYDRGGLEIIKRHRDLLKPRLGSFVICRSDVPPVAIQELQAEQELGKTLQEPVPPIELLGAGYDAAKLEPIINIMARQKIKQSAP